MKKLLIALCLATFATVAHATDVAYTGTFVGTEGLATKTGQTAAATYTRDMNTTGDRVSFQVVYSSYTGASASKTFTDGSSSTGQFTVSSNTFIQSSTPTITINGVSISYTPASTATGTAKAISDAIIANSSLNTVVVSTYASSVVYATSTVVGTTANFALTTSSQAALGVSAATMTGGTNSAYTINTPTITIASNGFTTGLQVQYTGSPAISGLTTATTYYVAIISPNATTGLGSSFKLCSTLANAQAGTGIVLASSQTKTTADTYTLAPLSFANTSGGGVQLQWSDDGSNWTNITTGNYGVAITSITFSGSGGTTLYDLGFIQHRYLRASETPPTAGAVTYTMTDNERYSFKH
jgi:hypothetical protein